MDPIAEIKIEMATMRGDINNIVTTQKKDSEFLRNEVHFALNSHADIKRRLEVVEGKEFQCPIKQVQSTVEGHEIRINKLNDETGESRAKYKYPDIKNSLKVADAIKTISMIIGAIAGFASFVYVMMKILKIAI